MNAPVTGLALPAVPALAAALGFLLPPGRTPRWTRVAGATLGVAGAVGAFGIALTLLLDGHRVTGGWTWARFGDVRVTATVLVDRPAAYVAVAVGVVAAAVQLYSTAYLHDDDRYAPYAAQVSLFTAAMLLVVVADDLILLLVGWEVMGICSYLLIGHDRTLPDAPRAAVKAFLVTRVGDVGFLLGIAVLGLHAGSFRIDRILAAHLSPGTVTLGCLLLLAGVAGKSAQFPLHTWLPDAMAGPTPISALIHAATMVAAGVYVVFRLHPLVVTSTATLTVLGLVAAVTILLGALAATAQDDLKRVLAWSTVSQIGYMTGALAVGSASAALFHLLTHAAFKALLFLAAGAVIHATGTNAMSRMGGLHDRMPVTFWSMVVGLGALAGVPPLAGFWSKDTVLEAAATARDGNGPGPAWVGLVVWLAALLGAGITAWYATRLLLRTFLGVSRAPGEWAVGVDATHPEPHDPPAAMRVPVLVLTVAAALAGLLAFLPRFRRDVTGLVPPRLDTSGVLALLLVALGIGTAWWLWRREPGTDPAYGLGRLRPVFAHAFYLDDVQDRFVVRPALALARAVRRTDERVVDGAVEGTGSATADLGGLLARAHRAALPRAAVAVVAGALLFGAVMVAFFRGAR